MTDSDHIEGKAIDVAIEPTPEEINEFYRHTILLYAMRTYDAAMMTLAATGGTEAYEKLKALHDEGKFFIPPPFPTEG